MISCKLHSESFFVFLQIYNLPVVRLIEWNAQALDPAEDTNQKKGKNNLFHKYTLLTIYNIPHLSSK